MDDAMKIANSLPMWIACGMAVAVVVGQAVILWRRAMKAGKKMGITDEQMKKAMKSSAITSIGPSVVVLSGMRSHYSWSSNGMDETFAYRLSYV